jgi:HAD superfamily hydrolase (TIGR01490 family)
MRLALFDLDHTLIPFDSGMRWAQFLVARGAVDAAFEARYLEHCRHYVAGTLDIHAMHRALVAPLRAFEPEQLRRWLDEFAQQLAATLPAASLALVARHRDAGDLCAVVTATTRFVAARYAQAFGIEHVLATEAETDASGRYTGEIAGWPCYREHKLSHVATWLAQRGQRLEGFERSWFYSDSASDLPLLEAVSDPVAVRPDPALRDVAERRGWPVIASQA